MRRDRRVWLGLLLACGCGRAEATMPWTVPIEAPLVVARGPIEQRLLLTGEVDAAAATPLQTPRTEEWQLSIRWLAEEGAAVQPGDRIVEFDNVAVIDRIREKDLAVSEAALALLEQRAKHDVAVADKTFEVRKQTAEVAKAELDAKVPAELLSRREAQNFALALARTDAALTTAKAELRALDSGGALERDVKRIAQDKALRGLEIAEAQLQDLQLAAPQAGIVIIADHPWENRKFQVGDNTWPGMTVAKLPDLTEMVVQAKLTDVDAGRVQPGMPVTCFVDALPDLPLAGFVAAVNPVAQQSGQQTSRRFFSVLVELGQGSQQLRPGLSVQVDVVTRREDDALLAPREALDLVAQPALARLADGRDVEIEVDFCDARSCAIASGLAEGDVLAARADG